jgi:protein SCO1/2
MRLHPLALALCAALTPRPATALTAHELAGVDAAPRVGSRLPLEAGFRDDAGRPETLGQALGGTPAILVFADYRCSSLCGPGLVLTALALDQTGLRPDRDYRFVVVGLDALDPPAVAASLRRARLSSPSGRAAILLGGGRPDLIARAAGYRYLFDAKLGQYVHDTVVYAVDPQGRVRGALSEFTLDPRELRSALANTPARSALAFDQIRLICHGLAADFGRWDGPALAGVRLGGLALLALLAAGLAAAVARRRRAR